MKEQTKKSIFYFEDEFKEVGPVVEVLKEKYEVTVGALVELIEKVRTSSFDLVIIDLMIHHYSFDEEGHEVENISFKDIDWKRTGVEFLRQIRRGHYEKFGFSKDVPVIIASALVDYNVQEELKGLEIDRHFDKPFIIQDIERVVRAIFNH